MFFFNAAKRKRALLPVFLTYFLDNFGLAIIFPIFTPLLLKSESSILSFSTPYSERTILLGLLIASFPLAQFFGAPLIGQFSDRFGRRRAFLISILGTALGYTFTALSLLSESFAGLMISRCATGFFAGNLTLCLASIADLSHDDSTRTRNFSLITAIGGLSFLIAIAFGGVLSDPDLGRHFHPSFPFFATAVLAFLNFVCMYLLFEETHKVPRNAGLSPFQGLQNLRVGFENVELRTLFLVNFLFMLGWLATMQFLPSLLLKTYHFGMGKVVLCLMGSGVIWFLSNFFLNRRLALSLFPGKTLLASLLLLALCLLFTMLSGGAASFLILFALASLAASLCWTNGLATLSLKAPLAIQGSILGINQSMTAVAAMLSPTLGGLLAALDIQMIYIFGGIAALTAFCILGTHKSFYTHKHF